MNVSPQDAQQSLQEIERTLTQTRRALAHGGAPYYLILWGCIWLVGYLISQFAPALTDWSWPILDVIGVVLSFWIGYRQSQRVSSVALGPQIGFFWLALIIYEALWIWLLPPQSSQQLALMLSLYAMFGYVVMGLWLRMRAPIIIAVGVSALALLAYFLLPGLFYLAMGVLGGGTLILSGWLMHNQWR